MNNLIPLIKALAKPDQAMVTGAVNDWLDDHPEATTTVQDGSITKAKLATALQNSVDSIPAVDATLATAGAAADAAKVGEDLTDLKGQVVNIAKVGFNQFDKSKLIRGYVRALATGALVAREGVSSLPILPVTDQTAARIRSSSIANRIIVFDATMSVIRNVDYGYYAIDLTGASYYTYCFNDSETNYDTLMLAYTGETTGGSVNTWPTLFGYLGNVPFSLDPTGSFAGKLETKIGSKIDPDTFLAAVRADNTIPIAIDAVGNVVATFYDATGNGKIWVSIPFACKPFDIVVLDFYGKSSAPEYSSEAANGGCLIVEFFDANNAQLNTKYNCYALTKNSFGYHRAGFAAPAGTASARLRVATRANTSMAIHSVNLYTCKRYPQRQRKGLLIDGHLGCPFSAPENTIPSFELGLKMGHNLMITNVAETSDNVLVVIHDDTIDRTSNSTGSVNTYTFAQLQQYDFGSWFSAYYAGTKIPRFIDVCRLILSYGASIGVSLHNNLSSDGYDALYDELQACGAFGSLMFKTPYLSEYDDVHARFGDNAEYTIYFGNLPTAERIAEIAEHCGAGTTVEFSESYITKELVEYAKTLGLKVSVYFGNELAMMKEEMAMGVSRFTVDTFSDVIIPFE